MIYRNDPIRTVICEALEQNPSYKLTVCGHSLGGGISAIVAYWWNRHGTFRKCGNAERGEEFVQCVAFAPPPVLTRDIAENSLSFTTTLVNEDDIVPRLSIQALHDLINKVIECSELCDVFACL